jgi:hypothetical protein
MTMELTNEEKINIINSHIKNIAYNKYNSELELIEENAKPNPDEKTVITITEQISQFNVQVEALNAELAKLK